MKKYLLKRNLKSTLQFCLIFLGPNLCISQRIIDGHYANEQSKEFVYITKDSILFRISNRDAFGSFSIARGTYHYKGRNKYHVKSNNMGQASSFIDSIPRIDSAITLKAIFKDNSPIAGAYIYMKANNKPKTKFEILGVSNEEGILVMKANEAKRFLGIQMILQVKTVSYTTQQKISIRQGYDYTIKSTMPMQYPFTLFQPRVLILKPLGNNEIEVEIGRSKNLRKYYGTSKLHMEKTSNFAKDLFFTPE